MSRAPRRPVREDAVKMEGETTVRNNAEEVYSISRKDGITPRAAAERIVIPRIAAL